MDDNMQPVEGATPEEKKPEEETASEATEEAAA